MAKRLFLLVLSTALLGGGGFAGWRWWAEWRFQERTDNAYVHADITPVSAKVSGHVVELAAADNQRVAKGQILLRIDDRDFTAKREEARANVAAAKAQLGNIETRLAVQHTVIASATAELAATDAEVVRARQENERSRRLVKDDYVSRQRLDKDEADSAKAMARRRVAQAARDGAEGQLEVFRAERQVAEANLWRAEAALAAAEVDLDGTVVRAPVDGIVGNRAIQLGQFVRPGAVLLALVPQEVWVEANFKETQIRRIALGQRVGIAVDAFPDVGVAGTVDSFSPASGAKFSLLPPENATGNFTKVVQRIPVRVRVDGDNALAGRLRPGMSVIVTVETGAAR